MSSAGWMNRLDAAASWFYWSCQKASNEPRAPGGRECDGPRWNQHVFTYTVPSERGALCFLSVSLLFVSVRASTCGCACDRLASRGPLVCQQDLAAKDDRGPSQNSCMADWECSVCRGGRQGGPDRGWDQRFLDGVQLLCQTDGKIQPHWRVP